MNLSYYALKEMQEKNKKLHNIHQEIKNNPAAKQKDRCLKCQRHKDLSCLIYRSIIGFICDKCHP